MKFCWKCGAEVSEEQQFCRKCGAALKEIASTQGCTSDEKALKYVIPIGRSPLAIAAGYLGLFSVLGIFAPFALLCGILALKDIKQHPEKMGKGRAIFGIIMGSLGTILLIVFIAVGISSH